MNGQNEQEHNDSTTTPKDAPASKQRPQQSPLAQMRVQQAQEALHNERKLLQREKEKFRRWKKDLCRIIQTESEMVRNLDGSYSFVLPPKITRLVYEVMLREHVKLRGCTREEAASAVRRGFLEAADKLEQVVGDNQAAIAKAEEKLGRPVQPGDVIDTPQGRVRITEANQVATQPGTPIDPRQAAAETIENAQKKLGRPLQPGDVIQTPLGPAKITAPVTVAPEPRDEEGEAEAAAALAKMREEMLAGK